MAKRNKKVSVKKLEKPLNKLNGLFNDIIDNISYGANADVNRQREINRLSLDIDNVLDDEIGELKNLTGDDISVFLTKLFNDYDNTGSPPKDVDDIFSGENNQLFDIFKQRYKNSILLYNDLEDVSEQLYELDEAILTTRDSILTSDDISVNVSHTLRINNSREDEPENDSAIKELEKMAKEYNINQRLSAHITPNLLRYGKFYVYTIPYQHMFEQYSKLKANGINSLTESFSDTDAVILKESMGCIDTISNVKEKITQFTDDITISNDVLPIVESSQIEALISSNPIDMNNSNKKNSNSLFNDGVVDSKPEKFDGIKGCYEELINPKKLIPVKVLNKILGYYYMRYDETMSLSASNKNNFSSTFNATRNKEMDYQKAENEFINTMATKIVKSFDKKFLEDNVAFKELISNALIHDSVYKKKVHFQFIPAEYITEFAINRNADGEGTSILYPSLFNAKLYLGLLVFKITSILTKSNDTLVTYVKSNGIDKDTSRQLQKVARDMKSRQLNFKDLFNYTGMLSKAGKAKDIFMPVGKSGERGLEFDVIAGQDVDLNNDLMEMLRRGYISGTGVPSVMMNYINEADYSRTLIMANSKFASRVLSYQLDINISMTEWYKKLARYSTNLSEDVIESIEFILSAPKSINNTNLTDLISSADQVTMGIIKTITGELADQDDDDNILKDILYNKVMRDQLPMIHWEKMDSFLKDSKIEAAQVRIQNKAKKEESESY